ncbi:AsnC family transcriptional regulator [Candidatus Bathyarchaeota archaeon]|nr:AsnC family transcriptional regulator [Candidatus Bathyarchaeota archaeon]
MDEVDRRIISGLQLNGRATLEELAENIGYTSMGVRKRLQRLLEQGAIKVSALLNPFYFRLFPAIVLLEMESAEAMQNLLDRFMDCPRVVQIFKTLGGYNLIAIVVAEDQNTLESISIEKCSIRSGAGVRRSEFYPVSNIYFSQFLPVREYLTSKKKGAAPCGVDCKPCARYVGGKCVGCPATVDYRGIL